MSKPFILKIVSGLINISTCLVAVLIVLYRQDWFGQGDTYSFVFWTIPLAVALGFAGETIIGLFRQRSLALRVACIVLAAVLLAVGWTYCVALALGPWIGAFSIPILYLWIIGSILQLLFLAWRLPAPTAARKTSKVVLGLLSFPLVLIAVVIGMYMFAFASSYLTKPEKETFLIPHDFEGNFRVLYGEKCGIKPPYENDRRILEIPSNGILIIQPEFKAGLIDHEYYLVDKTGKRQKLAEFWSYQQRPTNAPGVLMGGSGSMGGLMPDGSSSSESPLAMHFTDFTVFTKDTTTMSEQAGHVAQQRLDSLTNVLVNGCRNRSD